MFDFFLSVESIVDVDTQQPLSQLSRVTLLLSQVCSVKEVSLVSCSCCICRVLYVAELSESNVCQHDAQNWTIYRGNVRLCL